jgi:hypothetical protein
LQRLFFVSRVDFDVHMRGFKAFVTQPECNNGNVDARL